ncbi:MAG: hypothetical protein RQ745_11545 [Longimicrobiales bacterium]|nr:hypothetical protein [Longimicrobiales bacterium]
MTTTIETTPGYDAARSGAALFDRDDLRLWRFTGRDPVRMLTGVVSGRMPERPEPLDTGGAGGSGSADYSGITLGEAPRHTVLTPKGRMVADLRLGREGGREDEPDSLWGIVPRRAEEGLREHLTRYLPPRFAKVEVPDGMAVLGVVGPEADALVSRVVLGLQVEIPTLAALPPGGTVTVREEGEPALRLVRGGELETPAFQIIGAESEVAAVGDALESAGAVRATEEEWRVVRVEEGAPAWGIDLDERTIPTEAGLDEVAIDHAKGCYTGQEVIVRIRDRGHVNRLLLRVSLGALDPPPPGTELFVAGRERSAAELRSAVRSPRFGETIGLAWVRQEVWKGEGKSPAFTLRPS